jgi:hypothetical protein
MNQTEKDLIELDRLLASIESKIDKTIEIMSKHNTTSNSETFLTKLYKKIINIK